MTSSLVQASKTAWAGGLEGALEQQGLAAHRFRSLRRRTLIQARATTNPVPGPASQGRNSSTGMPPT
jgi:hypothetical protein